MVMMVITACSPEDYGFGSAQYTAEQLVAPSAYEVTVEGNRVHLKSKLQGCTPLWVTPNGRSQNEDYYIDLPFAGDYEVTFGADTRDGAVYGEPYKFTISSNDFTMLSDPKWKYLAGEIVTPETQQLFHGKKWYPISKDYGVGKTVGPMTYCNPDDVMNDGSGNSDLAFEAWTPNWDPGIQSWLIAEDAPYMDSYMEFMLSADQGCTVTVYRGEEGKKGASSGPINKGKFQLALDDKLHPTISFSDCEALHAINMDETCSNYTQEIKIVELTPYCLQLATMRTNHEGAWWLIWSFVSEEVIKTDGACIPKEESGLLNKVDPQVPEIEDLATKLFTTEVKGMGMATGSEMTFVINDETPYDWMWWNGSADVQAWESVTKGKYNETWAPAANVDDVDNMTLVKKGDDIEYEIGSQKGKAQLVGNKLIFDQEISILTASSDTRVVEVKGEEWTVLKCIPGEEFQIGVPAEEDAKGNVSSYLVANYTYKAVGGGQEGPTVIKFNNDNRNNYIEADKYFRCQLYNPWGGDVHAIDPTALKVKKNQTLSITLKLSGFRFSQPTKAVIGENFDDFAWEPGCFDQDNAITINGDGTYTLTWTNNTGATCNWGDGSSALIMTMQYADYATLAGYDPTAEEADRDAALKAACEIVSVTVQ